MMGAYWSRRLRSSASERTLVPCLMGFWSVLDPEDGFPATRGLTVLLKVNGYAWPASSMSSLKEPLGFDRLPVMRMV